MNINLFGVEVSLEIILILSILSMILYISLFYSCSKITIEEGMELLNKIDDYVGEIMEKKVVENYDNPKGIQGSVASTKAAVAGAVASTKAPVTSAKKINALGHGPAKAIPSNHLVKNGAGLSSVKKEGFTNFFSLSGEPDLTVPPEVYGLEKEKEGFEEGLFSDFNPAPLSDVDSSSKEIGFAYNSQFSPNCCPSAYSNSMGCICLSEEQKKYLFTRGGNRNPVDTAF